MAGNFFLTVLNAIIWASWGTDIVQDRQNKIGRRQDLLFNGDKGIFPITKNSWKIETVRLYLFSFKRYLDYLVTKQAEVLQVSVQIKAGKSCLIASMANDVSTRCHQHALNTNSKLISSTQLQEYFESLKVKEIRALLDVVKTEGTSVLADKAITNCCMYLAAHTLIRNERRFVFHIVKHKTAATYVPMAIVLNKAMYQDY